MPLHVGRVHGVLPQGAPQFLERNPTAGVRKNACPVFTRFLSSEEIDRLHDTLDRLVGRRPSWRRQADIVRLLLLTGCRRGEIVELKWSEVDGDVLRLAKTKTGSRTVWLNEPAQAILAAQPRTVSPYVFPTPTDPARPRSRNLSLWRRARKDARIEDVRLHDLRHTVASQAVARGIALSTVAEPRSTAPGAPRCGAPRQCPTLAENAPHRYGFVRRGPGQEPGPEPRCETVPRFGAPSPTSHGRSPPGRSDRCASPRRRTPARQNCAAVEIGACPPRPIARERRKGRLLPVPTWRAVDWRFPTQPAGDLDAAARFHRGGGRRASARVSL